MVGKIVIHRDLIDRTAHLHAAGDVGESTETLDCCLRGHAGVAGRGNGRQRIHSIVSAGQ